MVALKLEGLEVMLGLEELWFCVGAGASVCELRVWSWVKTAAWMKCGLSSFFHREGVW